MYDNDFETKKKRFDDNIFIEIYLGYLSLKAAEI